MSAVGAWSAIFGALAANNQSRSLPQMGRTNWVVFENHDHNLEVHFSEHQVELLDQIKLGDDFTEIEYRGYRFKRTRHYIVWGNGTRTEFELS